MEYNMVMGRNEEESLLRSEHENEDISCFNKVYSIFNSVVLSLLIGVFLRIVIDSCSKTEPRWCLLKDESTGLSPSDLTISILAMFILTIDSRGRRTSRCAALFPRSDFSSHGLSMLLGFFTFFLLKQEILREDDISRCNGFEKCASTMSQRWISLSDVLALGSQYIVTSISKLIIGKTKKRALKFFSNIGSTGNALDGEHICQLSSHGVKLND